MVGVLAALVFVGVVATFMSTTTSSQASSSSDFSSLQTREYSAVSAPTATESYLLDSTKSSFTLAALELLKDNGGSEWLVGNETSPVEIYDEQKFNSKIINFNPMTMHARFEFKGYGEGSSHKTSLALYKLGGLILNSTFEAKNALYTGGNMDCNQALDLDGNATFDGTVKFQNGTGIYRGETWFDSNTTINNSGIFMENTYVNGDLIPENQLVSFEKNVGVEGDYDLSSTDIEVDSSFYLNGDFAEHPNKIIDMGGGTGNGEFVYTDNFTGDLSKVNIPAPQKINNASQIDIQNKLGMTKQTEDTLDISKVNIPDHLQIVPPDNQTMTVRWLESQYNNASSNQLWNEHLVVKVKNPGVKLHDKDSTFSKKVIFIVESELDCGGKFYNSSENSSTLIYVKKTGSLTNMGGSGLFKGYVHIEPENTGNLSFNFESGAEIKGAIHNLSDNYIMWNGNSTAMEFSYVDSALAPFASLKKDYDGGELELEDANITPTAAAYYFY